MILRFKINFSIFFISLLLSQSYSNSIFSRAGNPPSGFSFESNGKPLFNSMPGVTDTLEIVVLYVEFLSEQGDDNSNTTGLGTFNSSKKDTFDLDPSGYRKFENYLGKHMEFARNYFQTISNGRLWINWRIFPEPNINGEVLEPYRLSKSMTAYNPQKDTEERRMVFLDRKAQALMSFVAESIRKADFSKDPKENPFLLPAITEPNKFRSYLIFHAGHSGLTDGGRLGQIGADTPSDISDFYATKEDFLRYLVDVPEDQTDPLLAQRQDTLGVKVVNGKYINEVMMLSESASQDEVNFGTNGILVNQIARRIGMPDTWDVGTGFTQLGYFDGMDVGFLSLFGFIPVYPSAWIRYYMGWETPVEARPGPGGTAEYNLLSPLSSDGSDTLMTSVKIPINDREYLLVENRQRALQDSVTVYFSKSRDPNPERFDENDSVRVSILFMDSLFLDSLCDTLGKNCEVNDRKPEGIITGVNSYDVGLPSSGLLVWHVNEWFIEETIRFGYVNISNSDTKELVGINLVEADGDLSIGAEGKDQLNQSIFDFGSGTDMLPHIRKHKDKNENWVIDTVRYITPNGFANTNSWNDGRTHIVLEGLIPSSASILKGINNVSGDSVFNFSDSSLTLKVHWNSNKTIQQKENWQWPIKTINNSHPQGLSVLRYSNKNVLLSANDKGFLEVFDPAGQGVVVPFDTLSLHDPYDSLNTLIPTGKNRDTSKVPVYSLGPGIGNAIGSAVLDDSISVMLSENGNLYMTYLDMNAHDTLNLIPNDSAFEQTVIDAKGVLGPCVLEGRAWVVTLDHKINGYNSTNTSNQSQDIPSHNYHSMTCFFRQGNQDPHIALVATNGRVVLIDVDRVNKPKEITQGNNWVESQEFFNISSADFNRDGITDLLVLGSVQNTALMNLTGEFFPGYPQRWGRSTLFVDSANNPEFITQDISAPSIADIDADNYPDIVYTGPDSLHVRKYTGAKLEGWPFGLEKGQNVGQLYSSRNFPATIIGASPLIFRLDDQVVVLTSSPDGLIWAVDARGNPLKTNSLNSEIYKPYSGAWALDTLDWPLSVGGLNFDTSDVPFVHISLADIDGSGELELLANTGTGGIYSWSLNNSTLPNESNWQAAGGSFKRAGFFDASGLSQPAQVNDISEIKKFHIYPSPVVGPQANIYLSLGAPADEAHIRFYDLAGNVVQERKFGEMPFTDKQEGLVVDLKHLGPDVYTAFIEVKFKNGEKKRKFTRFGVVR